MSKETVSIILLNYGGASDTLACLDSLRNLQRGPQEADIRVVVVDNASPDDSVMRLKERLHARPEEFLLIESAENLGYSGGCNLGLRHELNLPAGERPDYIWLLNNDTTTDPGALAALLQESRRTGGLVGSLLLYPDGSYQQVGTRLNAWTGRSRGYPEASLRDGMRVDALSGASMLIPVWVLDRVGLLDETFFLYFEDGEFSRRCARAGFLLTVALDSRVYHKEGATTGRKSPATQYYYHRNRLRLFFRFATWPQKMVVALYAIFRLGRSVLKSLASGNAEKRAASRIALRAHWLGLSDFVRGIHGRCPYSLSHRS